MANTARLAEKVQTRKRILVAARHSYSSRIIQLYCCDRGGTKQISPPARQSAFRGTVKAISVLSHIRRRTTTSLTCNASDATIDADCILYHCANLDDAICPTS